VAPANRDNVKGGSPDPAPPATDHTPDPAVPPSDDETAGATETEESSA